MQSTCGFSIAARTRSVGLLSSEVWSEATTQSSWARTSSGTSTTPRAVMFASTPRRMRNGATPLVDRLDLRPLRLEAPLAEVVRVVGEAEELVAARRRSPRHLLDRRLAVGGPGRVAVHLAPEVAELDEPRQRAGAGRLELAAVLAQLRRDERVAEERVEGLLVRKGMYLSGLDLGDAVLGDREARGAARPRAAPRCDPSSR